MQTHLTQSECDQLENALLDFQLLFQGKRGKLQRRPDKIGADTWFQFFLWQTFPDSQSI
jgi:hypothetical protein